MKVALDTNILACAEGANGSAMRDKSVNLIERLPPDAIILPVQTLGEPFNVLVRKARREPIRAREAVLSWRDAYATVETSSSVMVNAMDLACNHAPHDLELGRAGRIGRSRMLPASVGGPPGGLYVTWSHRNQPVCRENPSPAVGDPDGSLRVSASLEPVLRRRILKLTTALSDSVVRRPCRDCRPAVCWERRTAFNPSGPIP